MAEAAHADHADAVRDLDVEGAQDVEYRCAGAHERGGVCGIDRGRDLEHVARFPDGVCAE